MFIKVKEGTRNQKMMTKRVMYTEREGMKPGTEERGGGEGESGVNLRLFLVTITTKTTWIAISQTSL